MQFDGGTIQTALDKYPRIELTRTPTPLDYLPTLSHQLGINLYLKRDDLTDLALLSQVGLAVTVADGVPVTAGLSGGETIVTTGASQLQPGMRIRPLNSKG